MVLKAKNLDSKEEQYPKPDWIRINDKYSASQFKMAGKFFSLIGPSIIICKICGNKNGIKLETIIVKNAKIAVPL